MAVRPDDLRRQISSLQRRGLRAVTFTEAVTSPSSSNTFSVTFDDAYKSINDLALPVLSKLGVPATVFVPTRADRDGLRHWPGISDWADTPWRSELTGASWSELSELLSAGWEVGSHTRSHPNLTALDDETLRAELEGSRLDCERHLSAECTSIAYPYGFFNTRVATAAQDAGYIAAAALHVARGATRPEIMAWPRLSIYRGDFALRLAAKRFAFTRAPRTFGFVQGQRLRRQHE